MIFEETYTLYNNVKIPKLGLGTWFIDDDSFDTAQVYGNEHGIGEGVKNCGVSRKDLFITTKLTAEIKNYEDAVKAIDTSLKTMGMDFIDFPIS